MISSILFDIVLHYIMLLSPPARPFTPPNQTGPGTSPWPGVTNGMAIPDPNPKHLANLCFYIMNLISHICLNRLSGALVGVGGSDFIGQGVSAMPEFTESAARILAAAGELARSL